VTWYACTALIACEATVISGVSATAARSADSAHRNESGADIGAAVPPGVIAGLDITAAATGLALFATVRRAAERG
jgi:hypothetical protein